jgi:hypothetical protein
LKLLYIPGHINGKPISRMLIDGSTAINPMSYSIFKKLGREDDEQKFLGKLNYLRLFIFNLSGKISVFAHILQLKNEAEFTWGVDQQHAFDDIKKYLSSPLVMKAPMTRILFQLYIAA